MLITHHSISLSYDYANAYISILCAYFKHLIIKNYFKNELEEGDWRLKCYFQKQISFYNGSRIFPACFKPTSSFTMVLWILARKYETPDLGTKDFIIQVISTNKYICILALFLLSPCFNWQHRWVQMDACLCKWVCYRSGSLKFKELKYFIMCNKYPYALKMSLKRIIQFLA